MKAPVFSALIPCKEDTAPVLGRVAELAAGQANEWPCAACYGSGWRYDPHEGPCYHCHGSGIQRRPVGPAADDYED